MKRALLTSIAALFLATLSARAEPPDEFAGEWPKGIAGAWCLKSKSKVGDGIEMLFTHGDCSKTPERSLQVKADGYRIAYDTCTIGKVMLWLGTGPRDEPDDYHKRYQMIASCRDKGGRVHGEGQLLCAKRRKVGNVVSTCRCSL